MSAVVPTSITYPEDVPCARLVNENLKLVEDGGQLNLPLSYLNKSCDFKKRYKLLFDIKHQKEIQHERYEGHKEYMKRYVKEYQQRPGVKKRIKEHHKKYYQRPGVKERIRKYSKEYFQKPGVRERQNKLARERYQKKKEENK